MYNVDGVSVFLETERGGAIVGWRDCDISDLCQLQRGFDLTEATRKQGTVPVYSSSGVSYFHCEAKLEPPAVITGRKGQLGRVFFVEEPSWPHDTTLWVKDFKGNDPQFVSIFLGAFRLERFDAATSVPTLNRNNLVGHAIRIPPLPEQRAIAAALGDVDALLEGLTRLIAKKRDLKQAAMQQLLTGQTRLPGFHGEWEESTVGREFEVALGKMLDAEKNVGIPKPYIGNRSVQWGRIEITELESVRLTRSDMERYRLAKGDLLVCEGGEVGRAAIWNEPIEECYYQKALHRLRPLRGMNSHFMAAILEFWADRGVLENYVTQTSIAHLPREKFIEVPILVPAIPEQTAIATVLSDMDTELAALEARRDKTCALKQAMMQELLTGKTRLV